MTSTNAVSCIILSVVYDKMGIAQKGFIRIASRWKSQGLIDDKSTLIQVIVDLINIMPLDEC